MGILLTEEEIGKVWNAGSKDADGTTALDRIAQAQLKKVVEILKQWGVVTTYGGKGFIEHDWQALQKEIE